jgi:hypothetical protein
MQTSSFGHVKYSVVLETQFLRLWRIGVLLSYELFFTRDSSMRLRGMPLVVVVSPVELRAT